VAAKRKATAATKWRQKDDPTVLHELPSGNVARLRKRVNLRALVRTGKLDAEIPVALARALSGDMSNPQEFLDAQDTLVALAFVEPEIVTDGKATNGAIHINDLEDEDFEEVWEIAFGGGEEARFRGDSGSVEPGGDGEDVRETSERAAEDATGGVPAGQKAGGTSSGGRDDD
jgi:hypothetical protein